MKVINRFYICFNIINTQMSSKERERISFLSPTSSKNKIKIDMRIKKAIKVSRARAIEIAMNHNCVSRDIAEKYTNSELKEILKVLKLKADF